MPKVSVIIPVYNTEKYLQRCLDSVCNQTLSDIEIICINDASTDKSSEILQEYSAKDERIKIIDFIENKGAAVARNTGITEASGEYIGFVDSDDYIDLNFYENLYLKANETNANIVKGSDYKLVWTDGTVVIDKQNDNIKKNKLNFWSQYTTAIYSRDFVVQNGIDFPIGLLVGEDPVFAMKCAILANKIEVIDNAQYYYVRREESLNSTYWDDRKIADYCKHLEMISEYASKNLKSKDEKTVFFTRLFKDINNNKNARTYGIKQEEIFNDAIKKIKQYSFDYPIKVLFDATYFVECYMSKAARRGIYWVSWNLLKKIMADERFDITLWIDNYCGEKYFQMLQDEFKLPTIFSNIMLGKAANYRKVPNKNFDIYNYNIYFNPAITLTQLPDSSNISYFNFIYDTIPCLEPKWYPIEGSALFFKCYRNLNKNTYLFSDSSSCKNDFSRFFYNIDPEKITVSPISTSQQFYPKYDKTELNRILSKLNVPEYARKKYIFYFGSVDDPRKGTLLSIKCFIEFIKKHNIKDLYFYLGGSGAQNLNEILECRLGDLYKQYSNYIIKLGYIDDEDVNVLYSNSLFFSFLSEYEGFGMPPLEAMQAGTPVICADNSSLPEVVGDAAILVNAYDEEAIIKAFETFYFNEDIRKEYIQRGLERSKMFSWDKTYKIISDKIIEVLQGKGEI